MNIGHAQRHWMVANSGRFAWVPGTKAEPRTWSACADLLTQHAVQPETSEGGGKDFSTPKTTVIGFVTTAVSRRRRAFPRRVWPTAPSLVLSTPTRRLCLGPKRRPWDRLHRPSR